MFGGAYTFNEALIKENISPQHIEENKNVEKISKITNNYNFAHGKPVHVGEPGKIGIKDITKPDYGDLTTIKPGETPVFWPCGVTAASVIIQSKIDFAITHSSGHMFISDMKSSDLLEYSKDTKIKLGIYNDRSGNYL